MASRGERQYLLLAEQCAFQHQVRAIEAVHHAIHSVMLDWGLWGRERFPGSPEIARPALWDMPGEPPERDENDPPAPDIAEEPIDEKRVIELDTRINNLDTFPAIWARLLYVNYVWRPIEWDRPRLAKLSQRAFLQQLHNALEALE